MNIHNIDDFREVRVYPAVKPDGWPRMQLIDRYYGESVLVEDEQSIRNLRAACDAALGEGEKKCQS
jgi:hypothetical protein